jgi:hypothetical protein
MYFPSPHIALEHARTLDKRGAVDRAGEAGSEELESSSHRIDSSPEA